MATVAGFRLPERQLRHGDLPLQQRPLLRDLRRRRLPRVDPPLPLPPPARARPRAGWPRPEQAQGGGLGAVDPPHAHVLLQSCRHHAALGRRRRVGDGGGHHRRRILRLLRPPRGRLMGSFCADVLQLYSGLFGNTRIKGLLRRFSLINQLKSFSILHLVCNVGVFCSKKGIG